MYKVCQNNLSKQSETVDLREERESYGVFLKCTCKMTSHIFLIKCGGFPPQVIASLLGLLWNFMGVMKGDQPSKVFCVFPTYRERECPC